MKLEYSKIFTFSTIFIHKVLGVGLRKVLAHIPWKSCVFWAINCEIQTIFEQGKNIKSVSGSMQNLFESDFQMCNCQKCEKYKHISPAHAESEALKSAKKKNLYGRISLRSRKKMLNNIIKAQFLIENEAQALTFHTSGALKQVSCLSFVVETWSLAVKKSDGVFTTAVSLSPISLSAGWWEGLGGLKTQHG